MALRRCRYCQQSFQPSKYHPDQNVCTESECQRRRRVEYHRKKIQGDPEYAQTVRDSQKKWRQDHADYSKQYRDQHPAVAERNRQQQRYRDWVRRIRNLVKNTLAFDLKHGAAEVWLVGPGAKDLEKNNLAGTQVFIVQGPARKPPASEASCKEHPSGLSAALA